MEVTEGNERSEQVRREKNENGSGRKKVELKQEIYMKKMNIFQEIHKFKIKELNTQIKNIQHFQ